MGCQGTVDVVVAGVKQWCHVQNTSVVNKYVESTEVFEGALDDGISAIRGYDTVSVCHRLTTCGDDFVRDVTGGSKGLSQSFRASAKIIHHHLCAATA
jgi:hypothetical protein